MHIMTIATDMSRAGVSTTVVALAECLSAQGVRVLVLDLALDITRCLLPAQPRKTIWNLYTLDGAEIADIILPYRGYSIIPIDRAARIQMDALCSSAGGWSINSAAINGPEWAYILRAILTSTIQDQYDICLIDGNRSSGYLVDQAIYAADTVLIPIDCGTYAVSGAATIIDKARIATVHTERSIAIDAYRIHLTPRVLSGPPLVRNLADCLADIHHIYDTTIGYSRYADRILRGYPVCCYHNLHRDMMDLAVEVIARHNLPVATL